MDQGRVLRTLSLGIVLLAGAAYGQGWERYHSTGLWGGRSFHIFGSHEIRDSLGFFHGYARPDRRIKHGDLAGQIVYEGYAEFNSNPGDLEVDAPYQSGAVGALASMRWFYRGMFFDMGLGLQAQNKIGKDLPSIVNSTPSGGFGWVARTGTRKFLIGVRFLHISNAGTHRKNAGQNQLLFYLGVLSF